MVLFYFINDEPFQSYFHTVLLEDLDGVALVYHNAMLMLLHLPCWSITGLIVILIVVASFGEKCWFSQFSQLSWSFLERIRSIIAFSCTTYTTLFLKSWSTYQYYTVSGVQVETYE